VPREKSEQDRGVVGVMGEPTSIAQLPTGWTSATIGELISRDGMFIDGDWVESKDQDPNGDVRLIQLADVGDGKYRNRSDRFLTSKKAIDLGCTFLKPGDVLIARMPDPLGRACIFPGDAKRSVTVVDVCIVRVGSNGINNKWLMSALNSIKFRAAVAFLQSGSTRKRISRGNLATLKLPVPPVSEQDRIVAKIEELFTKLDAGVQELRHAQTRLKRYRQAVLKAAATGELTKEWRESTTSCQLVESQQQAGSLSYIEPAEKLLTHILKERREKWEADQLKKMKACGRNAEKGDSKKEYQQPVAPDTKDVSLIPEGWAVASLDQLTTRITSGSRDWSRYYGKGSGTFIMAQNIRMGNLDLTYRQPVNPPLDNRDRERSQVEKGDLLVTIVGANTGDVCRVPRHLAEHYVCQSVALMRPVLVESSSFVEAYLVSEENGQRQFRRYIYGAGRPHLSFDQLRTTAVLFPPITEQQRITLELDRVFSIADTMEKSIASSLKQAERMRQSVLKQAFDGKLIPQDPNDEPAELLLERIKIERAKREAGKSVTTRRRTTSC